MKELKLTHYKPMETAEEISEFYQKRTSDNPPLSEEQVKVIKTFIDWHCLTPFEWKENPEQKEEHEEVGYYTKYLREIMFSWHKTGTWSIIHKGHCWLVKLDPENENYYERWNIEIVRQY